MSKFGTMALWHQKYKLGDRDHGLDPLKYDSFSEMAKKEFGEYDVYRAVYMHDRGGPLFSTVPFSSGCERDQIGFIYARKCDIKRRFGEVTKKTMMLAEGLLIDEVQALSNNPGVRGS